MNPVFQSHLFKLILPDDLKTGPPLSAWMRFFFYRCILFARPSPGSPVSAQPVIMATPHHPSPLPSGLGKALALVPGGGGPAQPFHLIQSSSQPALTMVRVVTSAALSSNLPNGYISTACTTIPGQQGAVEGSSESFFRAILFSNQNPMQIHLYPWNEISTCIII